ANGPHCTWWARWLTISPSGRVDVIICGRGGTRPRGPCQVSKLNVGTLLALACNWKIMKSSPS
ncbi:Os03g0818050, partial [Oryza sativa Japonica Group]